jgi:PRTRC genetic system protein C
VRVFVYDGREFPDPDPKMSVDEVRQSMTNFFPELANADSSQSKRGNDDIVEFKRRVGTKG